MTHEDPGPPSMSELVQQPQVKLRLLPGLVGSGLRLAWEAAPRELLLVAGLQAAGGLGLVVPILAGRDLLASVVEAGNAVEIVPVLIQAAAILLLLGLMNLATALASARDELLSELLSRHAQRRILDVACTVELEQFERPGFHNRLERATLSAAIRPQQLVQGLGALATALMGIVGAILALGAIEPLLVPITLATGVPLWLAGVRVGHVVFSMIYRLTPAERERSYLLNVLTRRDSANEVRAFGLAGFLRGRWEKRTSERLVETREALRARLRITLAARIISGAVLGGVLALLAFLALAEHIAVADAAGAAAAVMVLSGRLRTAAAGTDQVFEAAPFLDDLDSFLKVAGKPSQTAPAAAPPAFRRLIVEDLRFTYPSGERPVLDGVNLEIRAGEVVALVGENGSGKTTLAKLLCHLYRPQAGRILYDGVDTSGVDADQLRESVALLFQDFQRYLLSASDNVGMGRYERLHDRAAVRDASVMAGADGFLAELPNGYDSLLGPEFVGGIDLSGGQWQRVALARAFFRDASFVILDEPTTALDARAEHELFERVRHLLAGRTVLLISHRFSSVRSADRIYVLADGRVVEHGTHEELMAAGGRYAELFALQASGYVDPVGS